MRHVVGSAGSVPDLVDMELSDPCPARFDPEQMGKVVLNLLLNSRDAIGSEGEIRILTRIDGSAAELVVSDTGCGMSPEFIRNSLFRPFRTTKKRGIGIGMFQSKLIIDSHGGRIHVESCQGSGTSFRVSIPATGSAASVQNIPAPSAHPA